MAAQHERAMHIHDSPLLSLVILLGLLIRVIKVRKKELSLRL